MILASESYMRLNLASCAMARAREALTYNGIDDLDVRLERHAREFETAMLWMRHGVVSMADASQKALLAKSAGYRAGFRDAQRIEAHGFQDAHALIKAEEAKLHLRTVQVA